MENSCNKTQKVISLRPAEPPSKGKTFPQSPGFLPKAIQATEKSVLIPAVTLKKNLPVS